MADQPKKRVVKVEAPAARTDAKGRDIEEPIWTPTAEAKAEATKLRIFAWVGWIAAIAVEAVLIFWVLRGWADRSDTANMWLLIGGIVLTGVLASVGSVLWKKSNRLDPAAKRDKVRFFVQNQLGAIMSIIAFVPLIILVFMNKDMSKGQKATAGIIGIVVAAVATFAFGADYAPPSQEQYAHETNIIERLTGANEVFWVKNGKVFHVCEAVPDVNRASQDGEISYGTVAAAHAAGMERITSRWASEAVNHCGYTQDEVDAVKAGLDATDAGATDAGDSAAGDSVATDENPDASSDANETVDQG